MGMESSMSRVMRVAVETSAGSTEEAQASSARHQRSNIPEFGGMPWANLSGVSGFVEFGSGF